MHLLIEVILTLFPELLCGMKCVGGIISDCIPVSFVKDIDFKFKLSTTLSIKVCVVGFVFLFVHLKWSKTQLLCLPVTMGGQRNRQAGISNLKFS